MFYEVLPTLDLNHRSLASEVTALATKPQQNCALFMSYSDHYFRCLSNRS